MGAIGKAIGSVNDAVGSIGTSVGSIFGGQKTQQSGNAATSASMAQLAYQEAASRRLQTLLNDPSSVTTMGGFNTGLQAIERSAAGKGMLNSGNIMTALADYGNNYYGDQVRLMQSLAAGTPSPAVGAAMVNSGMGQQAGGLNGILNGVSKIFDLFGNSKGSSSTGSYSLGSSNFGSSGSDRYWPFESVSDGTSNGMQGYDFGGYTNNSSPIYTWDSGSGGFSSGGDYDFGSSDGGMSGGFW